MNQILFWSVLIVSDFSGLDWIDDLSEKQKAHLEEVFNDYDSDKSGTIDVRVQKLWINHISQLGYFMPSLLDSTIFMST